ncbi:hypothetical protein MTO96_014162 [Rhipicephalus appendiculatus]
MDRACGAVSSEETCWLCDDLTAWNRVTSALGLELEESRPGMLLLRCSFRMEGSSEQVTGVRPVTAVRRASFRASWLLRHHPCIQYVIVSYPTSVNPPVEETPFQIHLRPQSSTTISRRLRGLHIKETSSARLDMRGFDTVIGLEVLYIDVSEINEHFAGSINELIEHNLTTLKKVDIREFRGTLHGLIMLENLVACECLSLWSAVREGRIPDMEAMVSLMRVSTTLKEVTAHPILQKHLALIAKALETNHTLTKLSLNVGQCSSIVELFRSLELNKFLKELHLLGPWTEPYLKILSSVLASSRSNAEQIILSDIGELSLVSVSALCNDLTCNKRINHFIVTVKQEPDARVTLLCETIKKNRYIKIIIISIENVDSAKEILHALTVNTAVTFLRITFRVATNEETTEVFSDMLSRNSAITGLSLCLEGQDAQRFIDSISKAMSRNRLIVSFDSHVNHRNYVPSSILESVRRNKGALHRAVEFVLQRRDDRRGAECFERFVGRPCMMTHLAEVGGITDAEARLKVVAAEDRIREKYFVLTGIVRHSIVCWPADVTQIDALSPDCWRAIARFLWLNDVSSE